MGLRAADAAIDLALASLKPSPTGSTAPVFDGPDAASAEEEIEPTPLPTAPAAERTPPRRRQKIACCSGSAAAVSSGCHCTTTHRSGRSTPSTVPLSARRHHQAVAHAVDALWWIARLIGRLRPKARPAGFRLDGDGVVHHAVALDVLAACPRKRRSGAGRPDRWSAMGGRGRGRYRKAASKSSWRGSTARTFLAHLGRCSGGVDASPPAEQQEAVEVGQGGGQALGVGGGGARWWAPRRPGGRRRGSSRWRRRPPCAGPGLGVRRPGTRWCRGHRLDAAANGWIDRPAGHFAPFGRFAPKVTALRRPMGPTAPAQWSPGPPRPDLPHDPGPRDHLRGDGYFPLRGYRYIPLSADAMKVRCRGWRRPSRTLSAARLDAEDRAQGVLHRHLGETGGTERFSKAEPHAAITRATPKRMGPSKFRDVVGHSCRGARRLGHCVRRHLASFDRPLHRGDLEQRLRATRSLRRRCRGWLRCLSDPLLTYDRRPLQTGSSGGSPAAVTCRSACRSSPAPVGRDATTTPPAGAEAAADGAVHVEARCGEHHAGGADAGGVDFPATTMVLAESRVAVGLAERGGGAGLVRVARHDAVLDAQPVSWRRRSAYVGRNTTDRLPPRDPWSMIRPPPVDHSHHCTQGGADDSQTAGRWRSARCCSPRCQAPLTPRRRR